MNGLRLYGMIITKEMRRHFTYRSNLYSGIITGVFTLAVRYALWMALYATGSAQGSSFQETITFFVINDIALMWIMTSFSNTIGGDVRSGDIAQRLIKPYPYHLHLISLSHAGALCRMLSKALPMFFVALIWIGLQPPVSFAAFFFFIVTAVFGGVIYALVDFIISYTVFWLTDYWYVSWLRRALFVLFGGMTLPLWFYPAWLSDVCDWLPFRYAVYQPMAFYLGRVQADEIGFSLMIQLMWIAVLFLLERVVWNLAQRKITVQGG